MNPDQLLKLTSIVPYYEMGGKSYTVVTRGSDHEHGKRESRWYVWSETQQEWHEIDELLVPSQFLRDHNPY